MKQQIKWLKNTAKNIERLSDDDLLIIRGRIIYDNIQKPIYILGQKKGERLQQIAYYYVERMDYFTQDIPGCMTVEAFAVVNKASV